MKHLLALLLALALAMPLRADSAAGPVTGMDLAAPGQVSLTWQQHANTINTAAATTTGTTTPTGATTSP